MKPNDGNDPLHSTDHDPRAAPPVPDVTSDIAPDSPPGNLETASFLPGQGTAPARGQATVAVPDYKIECVLGRGGMGVVYKALNVSLKRTVALKMILAGGHAGAQELARFRIEAEAVARLQHPNIVQIHEVGEAGGYPYCALEFVEGGNLADKLKGKPMPAREAAKLVESLARAMQLAHSRNVVHRDLKPANILLTADGTPKITDFGLARQMDSDSNETQAGAVMGTPAYMAPEQASGHAHEAGPAADVYALGAILYECLTGRTPFKGTTIVETLDQVRTQEPAPPSRNHAGVPLDLDTICLKCLRKEPENRYASAAELADELVRYLNGEPILARPVGRIERAVKWVKRNPTVTVAAAAVVLSLAIGTTMSYLKYLEADHERTVADGERATAQNERAAAQKAEQEMERIAAQAEKDKDIAQRENYRSTIKLAESMLQGDAQARYRVADILWGAQPELRGWEWGHLMARCPLEEWSLETHHGGLEALIVSSDGRFLATAGRDGTVALWDSWTRKELWRRKIGRAATLEIDPRTRFIVVAFEKTFRILDIATGQIANEVSGDSNIDRIAFSLSGKDLYVLRRETLERIATANWARLASVPRKIPNQRLFVDLAGAYVGVHATDVDANERRMALFDAHTLRPVADFDPILPVNMTNLRSVATPVLHSGLGELVYSDGPGLFVNTLARDGKPKSREFFQHPASVEHLVYDPRSQTAIAASSDGTVTLKGGDGEIRTLSHGSSIRGLALLPDGRFVTGGADGLLKCWKPSQSVGLAANTDASPSSASASMLAFANHGDQLLYRTWERNSHYLINMSDLTFRKFDRPEAGVYANGFPMIRPGTNELVVNQKGGLSFYGLSGNGTGIAKTRSIDFPRAGCAAFDASGQLLVVGHFRDHEVAVLDISVQRPLPVPEAHGEIGEVALNPAGTRGVLRTNTDLQVWNVASGRLLNRLDSPADVSFPLVPVFHPDGDLVAFEENREKLILWDTALGKMRTSIQSQRGLRFASVAFSPDGNRLLTCEDAKLRIWDWRIGKDLFALSDAKQTVNVAASPDGLTIAVAGWNPSLRIAKALPWTKHTRRNAEFYDAVDDLWIYTAQRALKTKEQSIIRENQAVLIDKNKEETTKWVKDQMTFVSADEAEILGDIQRRRGQTDKARAHYIKAIEIRQTLVRADPLKAQWQYRLATVYEKRLTIEAADDPAKGVAVLKQAVEFWEALVSSGKSHPNSFRYVLDFRAAR